MKKNITLAFFLMATTIVFAQVGVNTNTPQATLDIVAKKGATDKDGLIAPRLTRAELTAKGDTLYGANQNGTLVFITNISGGDTNTQRVNITELGYYYFDSVSNAWKKLANIPDNQEPWRVAGTAKPANKNDQNIYQNANIGIGDFSNSSNIPTEKLDINGNARIRTMANAIDDPSFNRMVVAKTDGTLGYDSRITHRLIANENNGPQDITTSIPISDTRIGFQIFVTLGNSACLSSPTSSIILNFIDRLLFTDQVIHNLDTNNGNGGGSVIAGNGTNQITLRYLTNTSCSGGVLSNDLNVQVTTNNKIRVYSTTNNGSFNYTVNWIQP